MNLIATLIVGLLLVPTTVSATAPASAPSSLSLTLAPGTALDLVLIPHGQFVMGSPATQAYRMPHEGPEHAVTITRSFYMGIYDVTQKQFEAVMQKNPSRVKQPDFPVDTMTWDDAQEFCRRVSALADRRVRLPTEAEWEYACRAGTQTRFSYGDDLKVFPLYGWTRPATNEIIIHPVGQKKPNPWGLYDMHGDAAQLVSDWDGDFSSDAQVDPTGPSTGKFHVVRGGSCAAVPQNCSSTSRGLFRYPQGRDHILTFRIVVEVK